MDSGILLKEWQLDVSKTKVAILGSTSHIAKGLISNFVRRPEFSLHLYTRSVDRVTCFLASIGQSTHEDCTIHINYADVVRCGYDVIINCIGVGTQHKLGENYALFFKVTEEFDNLSIACLSDSCPDALYVSFSSGAVYGNLAQPANENSVSQFVVNRIEPNNYYAIARLNSEAKHRALKQLNIVDLRIFSYFSRYIDLEDGYFISDVMSSLLRGKTLITSDKNIVRDYLHPDDLFAMVIKCIEVHTLNCAFDVVSRCPVEKKSILQYFACEYGLKYTIGEPMEKAGSTGYKHVYCSNNQNAKKIGFLPRFSSMETIVEESKHLISFLRAVPRG
jgi:nucleoside-diphosphate-sugar epimerase